MLQLPKPKSIRSRLRKQKAVRSRFLSLETLENRRVMAVALVGNQLLQVPSGGNLSFVRKTVVGQGAVNVGNGTIHVSDYSAITQIISSIGLNFANDTNSSYADFLALSGWVQNPVDTTGLTQAGDPTWYYKTNTPFVSTKAAYDPQSDFAETFFATFGISIPLPALKKTEFMNTWLDSLKT